MLCDLCSTPASVAYQCKPFVMHPNLPEAIALNRDLYVCSACSALIEAEQWKDLIDRSVSLAIEQRSIPLERHFLVRASTEEFVLKLRKHLQRG